MAECQYPQGMNIGQVLEHFFALSSAILRFVNQNAKQYEV
jgi:hypothetical protein